MDVNPHARQSTTEEQAVSRSHFSQQVVTDVPERVVDASDQPIHSLAVTNYDNANTDNIPILTNVHGDIHPPLPDTQVVIARRRGGRPLVLGTAYTTEDSLDPYVAGERVLTHQLSDAKVHFEPDGTLTVQNGDGTTVTIDGSEVSVDGGTQGVVTDVNTTTDSDGHVTSISLERSDTLLV